MPGWKQLQLRDFIGGLYEVTDWAARALYWDISRSYSERGEDKFAAFCACYLAMYCEFCLLFDSWRRLFDWLYDAFRDRIVEILMQIIDSKPQLRESFRSRTENLKQTLDEVFDLYSALPTQYESRLADTCERLLNHSFFGGEGNAPVAGSGHGWQKAQVLKERLPSTLQPIRAFAQSAHVEVSFSEVQDVCVYIRSAKGKDSGPHMH